MKQARHFAFLFLTGLSVLCFLPPKVSAQTNARMTILLDALAIADVVQIMRVEGLEYADELNGDMLNGQGGGFWQAQVERLYDTERMRETVRLGLERTLDEAEVNGTIAFFQTETGARIIELENAARAAMADDAVEDIARQMYRDRAPEDDGRLSVISEFVDVNDLVERNISGALTSNYQFYRGLVDGDAFEMTEEEITEQVWAQEGEIREDTTEWLFGFLIMAYTPLAPGDLEIYTELTRTKEGAALTAALFEGFDSMYADISYALGLAAAQAMQAEDI